MLKKINKIPKKFYEFDYKKLFDEKSDDSTR